jgi:hypothetical protein
MYTNTTLAPSTEQAFRPGDVWEGFTAAVVVTTQYAGSDPLVTVAMNGTGALLVAEARRLWPVLVIDPEDADVDMIESCQLVCAKCGEAGPFDSQWFGSCGSCYGGY